MGNESISDNISKLLERVRLAAQKSQRIETDILVLAVSKTRPAADIRLAHKCGFSDFGENYLQEALEKIDQLTDLDLTWHFIGPIQSNKSRAIAEHFDWVHSVDRSKIARRLSEQRPGHLRPLQTCIQVNISGEPSKSGVTLEQLPTLAREMREMPGIQLRGLMAIPAANAERRQRGEDFAKLRQALESLRTIAPGLDTLSMGMSADLEAAIDQGSTLLRVGTGIFGTRNK